ncbi:MAG TPA: hypothetical protein VMT43_01295 [Acidimicrobiales bacterium]|nr:hypothetical protein [Acidimicrobiales bacterium]
MTLDPERRAVLLGAKLRALVASGWADDPRASAGEPGVFPGGSTLRSGDTGWVLVDDDTHRALGPALAWARQHDIRELHLLVEQHAALLSRRAALFVRSPSVWLVSGAEVRAAEPEPHVALPGPPVSWHDAAEPLRDAGLDVVVEHGEITGELLGLEVARVVGDVDGSAWVEVGVGRHDREAFAMLHAGREPAEALRTVIDTVDAHRRPGAPAHPLNRLAPSRWLRARVVADPALVGAADLRPVEGILPRSGVKDAVPEAAVGVDDAGRPVVVVASTGIDLDLVPTAADLRLAYAPDARLLLVVPERDAHPVTRALAAALVAPAEVVAIPGDWRGSGPDDAARRAGGTRSHE